jgi:hypothetical protein
MLEKWLFSGIARKKAMVRPDVNHEAVRLPDGSTRAMGPELVISPPSGLYREAAVRQVVLPRASFAYMKWIMAWVIVMRCSFA